MQLWSVAPRPSGQLEGSVEDVITGKFGLFRSDDQLIEFLQKWSAEFGRSAAKDGGAV